MMTLEMAKQLLAVAEKKASELGISEAIAIVDEGANLIAFHRMDGTHLASIDIAVDKAWTSAATQMPTSTLAQTALPGGLAFGIHTTNGGRVVILPGGIPLVKAGKVVGGIGASGGTGAQDVEVAEAAVRAFEPMRGTSAGQRTQARIGSIFQAR